MHTRRTGQTASGIVDHSAALTTLDQRKIDT